MIVNQSGGRKKLTRCMIDDKIPGEIRQEIPLVAAKDEVLWIVGGRISERYKITSQTEKVLEITYQGGNLEGAKKSRFYLVKKKWMQELDRLPQRSARIMQEKRSI